MLLDQNSDGTTVTYLNGQGVDNKLRQTANGQTSYFLADHLGSTNALVNTAGTITSQTAYDSFGNQTALATRYGFTGRERDELSGLLYYRARWYSAGLGRFISEDPIGFAGGDVNLYGYVGNKPLSYTDPSGKIWHIVGGVVIGTTSNVIWNLVEQSGNKCFDWAALGGAAISGGIAGGLGAAFPVSGFVNNALLNGAFDGGGQLIGNLVTGKDAFDGVIENTLGGGLSAGLTGKIKDVSDPMDKITEAIIDVEATAKGDGLATGFGLLSKKPEPPCNCK